MNALREALVGIFSALAVSLLVVGALALAITEGMVVPEAASGPIAPTSPLSATASLDFPELASATPTRKPTARLVAATTQAPTTVCQPVAGWERYTTLAGDSLDVLAAARGATLDQLMEANCLSSASVIPNTQLYLPRLTPTATPQALTATLTLTHSITPRPCGPPAGWVRYTIRAHDTLTRLSQVYRVRISDLQFANCMGSSIGLAEGDMMYVPNVSPNYTATSTNTPVPPTPIPPTAVPTTALPTTQPAPALALTISAAPAGYDAPGQSIAFTYTLRNTGNVTLTGPFAVSDDKNTSVNCSGAPAALAPNATASCSATYKIIQADLDAGSLSSHATATARYNGQTLTSKQATAGPLQAARKPALSLDNKANSASYNKSGQEITFTITVTNSGNVTLTNPTVTGAPGAVSCLNPPATLAPGAAFICKATYTTKQADLDAGTAITYSADASMKFGTQTITAKTAAATCPAAPNPALLLTISAKLSVSAPLAADKDSIAYTYSLKNNGNLTLKGPVSVSVTDNKVSVTCPAAPVTLVPGDSLNCTATYILKTADIANGSVSIVASAHIGATDSASVPFSQALKTPDSKPAAIGPKFASD